MLKRAFYHRHDPRVKCPCRHLFVTHMHHRGLLSGMLTRPLQRTSIKTRAKLMGRPRAPASACDAALERKCGKTASCLTISLTLHTSRGAAPPLAHCLWHTAIKLHPWHTAHNVPPLAH